MKIKTIITFLIGSGIVVSIILLLTTFLFIPLYDDAQKTEKIYNSFPTGSATTLKNLDIKGNVSKYNGDGTVSILVVDRLGQSQIITVNMNLLTKP